MKKYFLTFLFVLAFFLCFQGCQDDDVESVYQGTGSIYQQGFSLEEFDDPVIRENLVVDWSDPGEFTDPDGTAMLEFPARVGNGPALEGQNAVLAQKYSVVVKRDGDGSPLQYRVVRFLSVDSGSLAPVSFHDQAEFTGTVYYYDLKGRTEKLEGYKDGSHKSTFEDMEKGEVTPASKVPKFCGFDISNCESGSYVPITKTYVTDWYVSVNNIFSYKYTTPAFNRVEYVWVATGSSGPRPGENFHEHRDAPAPHGPGGTTHVSNHPVEIIKDPSFIGTKADCVYDKLAEINGNLFKKTIGEFIDDPLYRLTLKIGNCVRTDDSCTDANDVNNMALIIEDVNQSGLGLAASILHEGIHAEIYRYVNRHKSGVDPNDRPRLFQLYAYYKGWAAISQDKDYNWRSDAQHQYMVQHYVIPIAKAVRQLDNNKYDLSYYMAYGWKGLTTYGYTAKVLNTTQNSENNRLKNIVDVNSNVCK